jgi:hypothetical protein
MSIWQDVSYRHKEGVWELNIHTGEEREVKPKSCEPAPEPLPELPPPAVVRKPAKK